MATVNEYLNELLNKKQNNYSYTENEKRAYAYISDLLNQWKQRFNSINYYYPIQIQMELSGSKAKGDAIKGKSDIDIFVSITDKTNQFTCKDYYEDLYNFLKPRFATNSLRKQNVSIGISYAGCSIDVTPGKRINYNSYSFNNDYDNHFIYSRKQNKNIKTNIRKHINLVKNSGLTKEMMLIKIWRNCHNLPFPSIAIEIIVNDILLGKNSYNLYSNFKQILEVLRDSITIRKIIDPANTDNNIADTMDDDEKENIREIAIQSLSYDHDKTVVISKIVW